MITGSKNSCIGKSIAKLTIGIISIMLLCFGISNSMPENLGGSARITWVSSSTDTLTTHTLNQDYSANWSRQFSKYIRFRANMRFHRLGVDQERGRNSWQDQYQPSGELIWRHPGFTLSGTVRRSISSNQNNSNDLFRDNIGINLKTRISDFPIFTIRFDANKTYNKEIPRARHTRDLRSQFGAKYSLGIHNLQYSFTNNYNNNYINDIRLIDNNHVFRWGQTSIFMKDRLRFSSSYNLNYRSQTTEYSGGNSLYLSIPVFRGLYAIEDATPEFDALTVSSGLIDNNIEIPVVPELDIGGNQLYANIAVDFGFSRKVEGLYVYTNKPSGAGVNWDIYTSGDNLIWEPISGSKSDAFDINFSRYEIYFASHEARYIKAVRSGINDIENVLVTEITALIYTETDETIEKEMISHSFDISSNYQFSEKISSAFDLTFRKVPDSDFSSGREMIYFSVNTRHQISPRLKQNISFHNGYDKFSGSGSKNLNRNLSYNIKYNPLSTLDLLFSAVTRVSYINSQIEQELNSLLLHTNSVLWSGLSLNMEINYSKHNRFGGVSALNTWTYKVAGETKILPSLNAIFSYNTQTTTGGLDFPKKTRHQYALDSDLRLTRSILLRGRVSINDDEKNRTVNQNYMISWVIGTKLTLNGNIVMNNNSLDDEIKRYSVRLNYAFSSRGSIFSSYSNSETTLNERRSVESIQAGLRIGF